MHIDEENIYYLVELQRRIQKTPIINPKFVESWLNTFQMLGNQFKSHNSNTDLFKEVNSKRHSFESIIVFYNNNQECLDALQNYPGEKNEKELLLWLCRHSELLLSMTLEIVELLEEFEIDEDQNTITFKFTTGTHEEDIYEGNEIIQFGKFIPLNTEVNVSELEPLRYSVNFCNLAWDLYFRKLEEYSTVSEEDLHHLADNHPDKLNRGDLEYQLKKRGIII